MCPVGLPVSAFSVTLCFCGEYEVFRRSPGKPQAVPALLIQTQGMLVVMHVAVFEWLVLVPETQKRGDPEAHNYAHQKKNRDGGDSGRQLVGYHGQLSKHILARWEALSPSGFQQKGP